MAMNSTPVVFPSFKGYKSSSERASIALAGSRATGTTCEVLLRSTLWQLGLRFRKNDARLPGKPDIVFPTERVAVFCDGDFWHGRDWAGRKKRLTAGSNAEYWTAKIRANRNRDKKCTTTLRETGWKVVRLWEKDILAQPSTAAAYVASVVRERRSKLI